MKLFLSLLLCIPLFSISQGNCNNYQIIQQNSTICSGETVELSVSSIENNLIAFFPFNGNANDESGNGNNGTVNGASLTTDRFGNSNSAYYFDGIEITSPKGDIVRRLEGTKEEIDVSMLESGIYFLNINHDKGVETIRFIKQ